MKTACLIAFYGLLSLAAASVPTNVYALSLQPSDPFNDCLLWCHAHNKGEGAQIKCENQCVAYYGKHKRIMMDALPEF